MNLSSSSEIRDPHLKEHFGLIVALGKRSKPLVHVSWGRPSEALLKRFFDDEKPTVSLYHPQHYMMNADVDDLSELYRGLTFLHEQYNIAVHLDLVNKLFQRRVDAYTAQVLRTISLPAPATIPFASTAFRNEFFRPASKRLVVLAPALQHLVVAAAAKASNNTPAKPRGVLPRPLRRALSLEACPPLGS